MNGRSRGVQRGTWNRAFGDRAEERGCGLMGKNWVKKNESNIEREGGNEEDLPRSLRV